MAGGQDIMLASSPGSLASSTWTMERGFPATVEFHPIYGWRRRSLPYALFDHDERIGEPMPTELEVWKQALETGLISDLPVADEEGGQVLPAGFHVRRIDEASDPRPDWKLPRDTS